jgi:hypothetical protein
MGKMAMISLIIPLLAAGYAWSTVELEEVEGYLPAAGSEESITIYCDQNSTDIEFSWPPDADFVVKIAGMYGDALGEFPLSEGEVITLNGGGRFTLTILSRSGAGAWGAKVQNY